MSLNTSHLQREPEKELLDHLPPGDPAARSSRRDLVRINAFMGNFRFIRSSLKRVVRPGDRILELGAGDARLARTLPPHTPPLSYTGLDTAPAPDDTTRWLQTDVLTFDDFGAFDVVVANLLLHHFENDTIRRLGQRLTASVRCLIVVEPWRHRLPATLMRCAHPLVHPVTRHDSAASIRAGFRAGELPGLLGVDGEPWDYREKTVWRGAVRMVAWKPN
jgi:SAM-dependent methyltransferase